MSAQPTQLMEDQVLWISCISRVPTIASLSAAEGSEPLPSHTDHFSLPYQPLWYFLFHPDLCLGDRTAANLDALRLLPQLAIRNIRDFCSSVQKFVSNPIITPDTMVQLISPDYSGAGAEPRWIGLHQCDVSTLVIELDKLWFRAVNLGTPGEGAGDGTKAGFFGLRGEVVLEFGACKNVEEGEVCKEDMNIDSGKKLNPVPFQTTFNVPPSANGRIFICVIHSSRPPPELTSPPSDEDMVGKYRKSVELPLAPAWTTELLDGIVRSAVEEMGVWRVETVRIMHSGKSLEDKTLLFRLWRTTVNAVESGGRFGNGKGAVFEAIVSATWTG